MFLPQAGHASNIYKKFATQTKSYKNLKTSSTLPMTLESVAGQHNFYGHCTQSHHQGGEESAQERAQEPRANR
jgi:hypothetical protein